MEMPHRLGFETTPPPAPGWDRHLDAEVAAEAATGFCQRATAAVYAEQDRAMGARINEVSWPQTDPGDEQ